MKFSNIFRPRLNSFVTFSISPFHNFHMCSQIIQYFFVIYFTGIYC